MFKIQIPKPCHEDWTKMLPTEKGAFCKSCAKEVVDFTKMEDAEVKDFFLNKTHGICGRFNAEQIQRVAIELPQYIFYRKIADWKKYLAIVLLVFGSMLFGCHVKTNEPTTGIILVKPSKESVSIDSVCTTTMGTPAFIKPDSLQIIEPEKVIVGEIVAPAIIKDSAVKINPTDIFVGDVEIIQVDTIQQTIKPSVLDSTIN